MKKSLFYLFSLLFVILIGCQENSTVIEPTNQNETTSLAKVSGTYVSNPYWIDGSVGGKIRVVHNWINDKNEISGLKAVLYVPANSFSGLEKFYMVFNLENNYVSLYPSPKTFDKPLIFSFKLVNVNVNYPDLDFKYLDGNEPVVYESNTVDMENGILEVRRAQLNHFSDWGWDR